MKRKKWLLLAVLVVALGGGGFGLVRSRGNNKDIPPLVTVREGPLALKVSETGTVQPLLQVEVKSKVGGRIKRMYVDEGDWVKAGQIVAELEVPELERQADQTRAQVDAARARVNEERAALTLAERQTAAELDQAKAALAEAQARLEQVRAGPRQQEIARAKAAVGEAQVRVADARRTLERKRDLLAKGFVSQQEVDAAQTENDVTKQALDQAQESLNLLLAGSRPEEVRAAEQEVARSRALLAVASANLQQVALRKATIAQALAAERQIEKVLEEVETRLHDAVIFAPRSGRVIRRSIREGELITSGVATFTAGMPIVTIADLSKMLVKVNLNEVDIARVHLGAPAEITLDALHGRRFHGRVSKIAPSSTEGLAATDLPPGRQAIVRFPVEVEISDPCPEMRPGMTANIDLIIERADRAVFVPNDAVHGSPQRRVWLMTPEGLREQPVETGIVNETYTQIKSGLKAGDKVALHIKVPVKRRVVDMERSSAAQHIRERAGR
jgi:HlyD family secretion protein